MSEKPSPFCPDNCLFSGAPIMCDKDCFHSFDVVYENPRTIEMKWEGQWIEAKIIGESQGKYYIESDKGNFTCDKRSPLIK